MSLRKYVTAEDVDEFWRLWSEEDKTCKEIAELTGWSKSTVATYVASRMKLAMESQDIYCEDGTDADK